MSSHASVLWPLMTSCSSATPLFRAVSEGYETVVATLMHAGASHAIESMGLSVAHVAARAGHQFVLKVGAFPLMTSYCPHFPQQHLLSVDRNILLVKTADGASTWCAAPRFPPLSPAFCSVPSLLLLW